jgi:hypothetical protein
MRMLWDGMARKATNLKDAGRETAHSAKLRAVGRRLTLGELRMVQAMFGTTTGFGEAKVVARNMWWPYPNDRAITPNGNIFFPHQAYRDDYSVATVPLPLRALFHARGDAHLSVLRVEDRRLRGRPVRPQLHLRAG